MYQYDAEGNRTRIAHPDNWFFKYGFDGLNRFNSLEESTVANPSAGTEVFVPIALLDAGKPLEAVAWARAALEKMDARRGTGKQYAQFVQNLQVAASQ